MFDSKAVIESLIPHFIRAGRYALQIQPVVRRSLKTSFQTRVSQAVTDADLAIQNYFEVALLAEFPEFAFYGEEESRNAAYFPDKAEITISLDPINHTLPFQDGLPIFDIILSISQGKELIAALTYIPSVGEMYIGIKDQGGFFTTKEAVLRGDPWQSYRLPASANKVLTYNNAQLTGILRQEFEVVDLELDYSPDTWCTAIHSILRGEICGYVRPTAHIIDWGAIACIAVACGGIASDFQGSTLPSYWDYPRKRIPSLVVSANAATHESMLRLLATI